jgi:hypothetical protein
MQYVSKHSGGLNSSDFLEMLSQDSWAGADATRPGNWLDVSPVQTAAVGSLGTIASFAAGGSTATKAATASTAQAPTQVTTIGSGLVINLIWDSSVGAAPAGFTSDLIAAARFLESQISNAVTVNLNVGYNEINGAALSGGALGESETNLQSVSYSALIAALGKTASTDATDASVLASLPAASPTNGAYWLTTTQAKALGLAAANGTGIDGAIGFGTASQFTFGATNTSGTIAANTYDFFSTAVHELTESMGRMLLTGSSINGAQGYTLLDLMHYSAPGTSDFTQSTPAYFSVDGGATNLGVFNTVSGGDTGDWAFSVPNDAFDAFATSGAIEAVSANDVTEMDALSWNLTGSTSIRAPTPSSAQAGVAVAAETGWLPYIQGSGGLRGGSPLVAFTESGGVAGDQFSYTLAGSSASAFSMSASGSSIVLSTGAAGLAGSNGGRLYPVTVTATDVTKGESSPAQTLNFVVAGGGSDRVNLAALGGMAASTPTFIYGLGGNDVINGTSVTGKLIFDGGAGADIMTGGTGRNVYEYGSLSDSTSTTMDIISNFNVKLDLIDLTGLGTRFGTPAVLGPAANDITSHSIGWQSNGGNTFVYVDSGSGSESLASTNMKIELRGVVPLTSANFSHA